MVETHVGGLQTAQRGRSGSAGRLGKHVHAFETVPEASKPKDSLTTRGNLYGLAVLSSTRGVSGSRGICCIT